MNKTRIYEKIAQTAIELNKSDRVYTRADIAYELNDLGIEADSNFVEQLVFEAYKNTSDASTKTAIKKSFFNNSFSRKLIDERSAEYILKDEHLDVALKVVKESACSIDGTISAFSDELSGIMTKIGSFVVKKEVIEHLSGSIQIKEVKAEAQHIYESYIRISNGYTQTRLEILALIDDFVCLRSDILRKYKESASMLIDVFGPKIKIVAPTLFDFDSISWLDVESMQKNITFELDRILIECGELIAELNQKFLSHLSNSSSLMGKGGNNNLALASAGLSILESWLSSAEKATQMRQKLEIMKNSINRDSHTIKKDLVRLTIVQKTINDIFIPKASVFQRRMQDVLGNDLDSILDVFESHPLIHKLNHQKIELLNEEQLIEKSIIDHKKEIESNSFKISRNESLLKAYRPLYLKAKSEKPKKPWLPIGSLNKKYNRNLSEWHTHSATIIRQFDEVQSDLDIEVEDLTSHQTSLTNKERELAILQQTLTNHSFKTQEVISKNTNLQTILAQHLTPLVNLLRAARAVVEQKLEDSLIQVKTIEKIELEEMPKEMQNKLSEFTSTFREEVSKVETEDENGLKAIEDTIEAKEIEIANTMVNLLDEVIKLIHLKHQRKIAEEKYKADVNELRNKYQTHISKLDNKYFFIEKLSQKANTGNLVEVRAALTLLGEGDSITEEEIINNLKNNITINL